MKKLHLLGLFAALCMVFTSCEEDPIGGPGTGTEVGPSVILLSETGFVSSDAEIAENSSFTVKLDATAGDNPLNAVTIEEDGITIDNSRLTVNGSAAAANPLLVVGDDTAGFTWEITVDAQNAAGDAKVFTFNVQDTNMNNDFEEILITTETGGGGGNMPPGLSIDGPTEYFASPGSSAIVNLIAATGSADLQSISVFVTDVDGNFNLVTDLNTLSFGDIGASFNGNPHILDAADQTGFAKPIYIKPDFIGSAFYRIVLEDVNGNSVSEDITMTSGTQFSTFHEGVLFNAGGPVGTGGLDLDVANGGTGSADASAEIRDAGIDGGNPDVNWIQRIAGVNGSSVRKINDVIAEGITFNDLELVEFVGAFHDAAPAFNYDIGGINYSDVVSVGDIFAVRGTSKDYLIMVREVNLKTTDNTDNYVLDVKF